MGRVRAAVEQEIPGPGDWQGDGPRARAPLLDAALPGSRAASADAALWLVIARDGAVRRTQALGLHAGLKQPLFLGTALYRGEKWIR